MSSFEYDRQSKTIKKDGETIALVVTRKGAGRDAEQLVRDAGGTVTQSGVSVAAEKADR